MLVRILGIEVCNGGNEPNLSIPDIVASVLCPDYGVILIHVRTSYMQRTTKSSNRE
jgi:hypothetical protein